jgi:hypothetical protein
MVNNKHTRKNNKQGKQVSNQPKAEEPAAAATASDDDGFGSILVKTVVNTTRSNKNKKKSEPVPAVPPPIPEWEQMGMTEEDFKALRERMAKQMLEWQMEDYKRNLLAELDSIGYWQSLIESLERSRERYNKKWGWSAEDISAVDAIDADIKECEENIARIESMYDDDDEYYEEGIGAY